MIHETSGKISFRGSISFDYPAAGTNYHIRTECRRYAIIVIQGCGAAVISRYSSSKDVSAGCIRRKHSA